MKPIHRTTALLLSATALGAFAQVVPLGSGGLSHLPAGQLGPVDTKGNAVSPRVAPGTKGPYPTNDWWSSLIYPRDPAVPFGKPLFAWPLTLLAQSNGWAVGAPNPVPSVGTEFHYGQISALVAQVEGLSATGVQAVDWTDWTVRGRLDDGTHRLDATFGHGLPYAHFQSQGGDALVTCMVAPVVWAGDGTDAVGITVAGNDYGLFAPPGSSWSLSGSVFRSNLGGKGHWSVAVLPSRDTATLSRFRRSAFSYPTDTRVTWAVDASAGKVRATYSIHSTAQEGTDTTTLMALFRHQWALTRDVNTNWSYVSAHGPMHVVDGSSFTTEDALPAILPSLPPPAAADTAKLRADLKTAAAGTLLDPGADTYWAGKGLWRAASLVDLADQLGEIRLRDSLVTALENELSGWFTASSGKTTNVFAIDSTWGSLIGYPASYGSDAELNDHHFHYGYFVKAASTVARYDPAWASGYAGSVGMLVRDANNPRRDDPLFPFLRHFDIYEGHSWASGHADFDAGNNQESSSEAMNWDAGVALWGMATGNDTLRDVGLWMAATEMRAVEQYWWDVDGANFPTGFADKAVGMVWGNGGAHATWFSGEPECIHGINVLPFTPSSLQWTRRPDRARAEWSEMLAEKTGGVLNTWPEVMFAYQAIGDPQGAWSAFSAWDGTNAEGGTPVAWYRQWLALLRDRGGLDTTVRADHPAAMALIQGGHRCYVAWNPGTSAMSVNFSDGRVVSVPAGKVVLQDGSATSVDPRIPTSSRNWTRAMARLDGLASLGSRPVTVRTLDGTTRFSGTALDASRITGDRIWIVQAR
jgi:endoglucanase Acf2